MSAIEAAPPLTLILNGVPDDRLVTCAYSEAARGPTYIFGGAASFLPDAMRVLPRAQVALIGPGFGLTLRQDRMPGRLVNHIGDADACSQALEQAAKLHREAGLPCFNAPAVVAGTTRDGIYRKLSGVPGIQMPRTLRIAPASPEELVRVALAEGLVFPLIVRIAGDHGGISMVRLDHADDMAPLHRIPWGGRTLYVTQFVDYAEPDGFYRKMRLVVVGNEYFARHHVRGTDWMLHAADRDPSSLAEEAAFLRDFDRITRPRLDKAVSAIRARLPLDYFGIDCSLRPSGELLLFEVNPCMRILHNSMPSPNIWDAPIGRIRDALVRLLQKPDLWASGTPVPLLP